MQGLSVSLDRGATEDRRSAARRRKASGDYCLTLAPARPEGMQDYLDQTQHCS
jgi:hypothetical protein